MKMQQIYFQTDFVGSLNDFTYTCFETIRPTTNKPYMD